MKFKYEQTVKEWIKEQSDYRQKIINTPWKRWFAWRPVKVGEGECCWMEWVEYNYDYQDFPTLDRVIVFGWKYRTIENDTSRT